MHHTIVELLTILSALHRKQADLNTFLKNNTAALNVALATTETATLESIAQEVANINAAHKLIYKSLKYVRPVHRTRR